MAEEIVRITGIQPKSENTASSGIGNVEFSDFVKSYEAKHQAMMNLVATTSTNSASIYNNILKTVDSISKKQVSYGNSVIATLSANNALAQSVATSITQGVTRLSNSLDVIGDLVLDIAIPKVDPEEQLAKQIMNRMIIDNRSYISKWKLDELDAMMHPSKRKAPNIVPQAAPGSSIANEMYAKLDEFYTLFDIYTSDASNFQRTTLRTLQDIYALGDLWSDPSVDVTTSMSKYVQDTYTLLDLYTGDQATFNKQVLKYLGSFEERLSLLKEQKTEVTQTNTQKYGINNKMTNVGVDQSVKLNYTGNIDVRSIKELLESNAIFNPARIAMIKFAFESVAKTIATGLQQIRLVLSPKKIGKDTFDDPIKTVEAATQMISAITNVASLGSQTYTKTSSKSIFGKEIQLINSTVQVISKSNTKRLVNYINSITASINAALDGITKINIKPETVDTLNAVSNIFGAINDIVEPKKKSFSWNLFGKEIIDVQWNQDTDKQVDKFRKSFSKIIDTITNLIQDISKIDTSKVNVNDISTIFSDILSAISRNEVTPKDTLALKFIPSTISSLLKVISESNVDASKAKTISTIMEDVVGAIANNKITPKEASSIGVLAGGIKLLQKTLTAFGAAEKAINIGKNAFINVVDSITQKFGSREVGKAVSSIKVLSKGIATLGIAIVAFAAIAPIAVLAAGVLVLFSKAVRFSVGSKKTTMGLAVFTTSLAMLGVSLWAFSEVAAEYLPNVIAGLGLLAGAIWVLGRGGKFGKLSLSGPPPYKILGYLAAGLATLGLAIWAWQELGITGEGMIKVAGGLAMLAGATWAFSKIKQTAIPNMTFLAVGVAALGGAMWVWQKLNLTWDSIAITAAGIAGIGIASLVYKAVDLKSIGAMAGVAAAVAGMSFAVKMFQDVDWETLGKIGATVAGLGIAAALMGNPIVLAGAVAMVAVGVGLLGIAGAITLIAKSGIDVEKAQAFVDSLGIVTIGIAKLLPVAAIAAATSALLLPTIVASVTMAGIFALLSVINLDVTKAQAFADSIKTVANGYSNVGLGTAAKAAGISLALMPVVMTSLGMAGIFALISNINIRVERIVTFGVGTKELVKAYDKLGLGSTAKAAAKAVMLVPLTASAFSTAILMRMISGLDINQDRISENADSMGIFLEKMVNVFGNVGPKVKQVKSGVEAVGGLANVIKSLADAVLTVSKMEYPENKIVDGKIVPVAIRKLTDKDFENVGVGIGKILNALIDPLITIGSAQETYTIGGFTIQNPFGSGNKVKKGINALKGIGEIFTPLADVVKSITESGALGPEGQQAVDKIQKVIGSMLSSLSKCLIDVSNIKIKDTKGIGKSIKSVTEIFKPMGEFISMLTDTGLLSDDNKDGVNKLQTTVTTITDTIQSMLTKLAGMNAAKSMGIVVKPLTDMLAEVSKANTTGITKIREEVDKLYDKLSNVKPWNTFRVNLRAYTESAGQIIKHINGVDLEKAILLSTMVKDLKDADENGNIERLIEQIKELIGQMAENQQQFQQAQELITQNTTNNTTNTSNVTNNQHQPQPQQQQPQQSNDGAILAELRRIVSKLNSKLIVAQSPADVWKVRQQ